MAVGAQWNPSETTDASQSGSVHYLIRPEDPTQLWTAIELPHEPTVHRMKWVQSADGKYWLVVLPLHGRGNQGGNGAGVKIIAYQFPDDVQKPWRTYILDSSLHLTHNFEIINSGNKNNVGLVIASKEGIMGLRSDFSSRPADREEKLPGLVLGAGEVRVGKLSKDETFFTTIEPMHGQELVVYLCYKDGKRISLDSNLKEGHALAVGDFIGAGSDQIVAGWRIPNKDGKVGIKLYQRKNNSGTAWKDQWVDENGMACEDIQVADLNGDGKPDIIASGRATKNLKIYWNKSGK